MISIRCFVSLFLTVFFVAAFGQDDDKGRKKPEDVLDDFRKRTEAYATMKAEFTYRMENEEAGINESKSGIIYISGDKYKLKIAGQEVFFDGETMWTYIVEADEIQINSVEENGQSLSPGRMLTSYGDDYKSRFVKEDTPYGASAYIIELVPLEGKTYHKVRMIIDKNTLRLLESTIFDNNGSTYSYVIDTFEHDIPLDGINFTFNPDEYPDAEVIDMR